MKRLFFSKVTIIVYILISVTVSSILSVSIAIAQVDIVVSSKKCPIISSVLKINTENNPLEVYRLQAFLNEYEGAGLQTSGQFDIDTEKAVKNFQKKYADTILNPWGATRASGIVSITTIKKINNIACGIPLVLDQSELNVVVNYSKNISTNEDVAKKTVINSTNADIKTQKKSSENLTNNIVNIDILPTKNDTIVELDRVVDADKSFMTIKFWWYLKELFN
jgi:hypothetical protein